MGVVFWEREGKGREEIRRFGGIYGGGGVFIFLGFVLVGVFCFNFCKSFFLVLFL